MYIFLILILLPVVVLGFAIAEWWRDRRYARVDPEWDLPVDPAPALNLHHRRSHSESVQQNENLKPQKQRVVPTGAPARKD